MSIRRDRRRAADLAPGANEADLPHALSGHTLAIGTLTGRYGRRSPSGHR